MWAFFSRRLRLWLRFALGAPGLAWVPGQGGDRLETRNGPTLTRSLQQSRRWLRARSRGPLARHDPAGPHANPGDS